MNDKIDNIDAHIIDDVTLPISSNYTNIFLIGRFCTRVCKIFRGHI